MSIIMYKNVDPTQYERIGFFPNAPAEIGFSLYFW